jgi:hypothetical protein
MSPENQESPEEPGSNEKNESPEEPGPHKKKKSPEERANVLGRLIDPEALATCPGARGKLCIDVPAAWLESAVELVVTAPARIVCARCDGGGCDGCGRSGALRGPVEAAARTLSVHLPEGAGDGAVLRIVRPFGAAAPIEQILVEVRPAAGASVGVARIDPAAALACAPRSSLRAGPWGLVILALVSAVIAFIVARWARGG